jgi:hypothetical protein
MEVTSDNIELGDGDLGRCAPPPRRHFDKGLGIYLYEIHGHFAAHAGSFAHPA